MQHFHLYCFPHCSLSFMGFNRIIKYIQPRARKCFRKVCEFHRYHPIHQKATNTATNKGKSRASVLAVANCFSLQLPANKRPKAPPPEDIPVCGSLHRDLQFVYPSLLRTGSQRTWTYKENISPPATSVILPEWALFFSINIPASWVPTHVYYTY